MRWNDDEDDLLSMRLQLFARRFDHFATAYTLCSRRQSSGIALTSSIMDLLSNVDSSKWKSAQPEQVQGLAEYTVLKHKPLQPGKFEFALRENKEDGNLVVGVLEGGQGKNNPLKSARNVELKVVEGLIVAVNLDGDCIEKI